MQGDLNPKPRKTRQYRTTDDEQRAIVANAKRYAGGNVSRWLRIAGMNYSPPCLGGGDTVENQLDASQSK